MKRFLTSTSPKKDTKSGDQSKRLKFTENGSLYLTSLFSDEVKDHKDDHIRITDVESTLPPIPTDQAAIDEYESSQLVPKEEDDATKTLSRLHNRTWIRGKSSIYVDAFNLALDTVLDEESQLFNEAEQTLFSHWRALSYEAQYLYVRLFLRKTSAWHRVNSLAYHTDVTDLEAAVSDLQLLQTLPSVPINNPDPSIGTSYSLAEDSGIIDTLEEASTLLKLDELKSLGKEAHVTGKNKKDLIKNLRRTSRSQTGLRNLLRRSDTEQSWKSHNSSTSDLIKTIEPEDSDTASDQERNRDAHFIGKILAETGPCIRLSSAPLRLFERVHLVFYRSTEWNEKSLTTIILARMSKRNFPDYIVSRSSSVFETRALLVEFENAIRSQFTVDNILEFNGKPTSNGLQQIVEIFEEIHPRWEALVDQETEKEIKLNQSGEGAYLRRLSPAWVYTRIIHKATTVFAKLKTHAREHKVLTSLLSQKLFHHARRGAWYSRKALLEEHYMADLTEEGGSTPEARSRHWKRIALQTCEKAVQDPLVHVIHHYDLYKRLLKLEKACKVPKREQHDFSHVRLVAPVEVTVYGIQVKTRHDIEVKDARGTRTVWLDPLGDDAECTVEDMCLSHYRSEGWKGFHCEGRLMRTIFAYLFYDIMFLYVPNVFQTPFQTCPLDLHTDAFYPCRMSEINHRLVEIENGKAAQLIKFIWDEHSAKETCIVGLDWRFEYQDLIAIVEAFDQQALATVCKVLSQDYGSRGGGMPDLFVWHPEKKVVKFVEVKSENDRLSDTQRLWIDVLTGAGIRVELCHALAKNA
jgi:Fanconi-associated nuclease 1